MKCLWVIALGLVATMSMGCSAKDEVPIACEDQCAISFTELVTSKDQYDGRVIYLSGFLALTNGLLSLQPSKEAYLSSVGDKNSIVFRIPAEDQRIIIDKYLNQYVSVRGRFQVGSQDPIVGIGYFSGNMDVYTAITRDEPEGIDQWRVWHDDL